MNTYILEPKNGQKSFYGKAMVERHSNGTKILISYGTRIIQMTKKGIITLLCEKKDLTQTTLKHVLSFCGLNKKELLKIIEQNSVGRFGDL